jgi:hypothetical protein
VQDELERDLGITFYGGTINGPIDDRDVGCVWIASLAPMEDAVVQAVEVRIRVFKRWRQPDSYPSLDPSELEDLAEQVQASLVDIRTSEAVRNSGAWFLQTIASVEIDPDTYGIEATMVAARANPFTPGG